jgi:hypothetical protein
VPDHCTTEVSRQCWCKGHHVPIEVFYKHYGKERADELLAAAAAPAKETEPEKTEGDEGKKPEDAKP